MDTGMWCPDFIGMPHGPEGSYYGNIVRGFGLSRTALKGHTAVM